MSENDSQRPQDVGNAGETQQQPRVQVESTPADSNIPYVQAYDTQTGQPLDGQQVVNKHTVVKTKTKSCRSLLRRLPVVPAVPCWSSRSL